jgi:large subunit ribosomal protein LP2
MKLVAAYLLACLAGNPSPNKDDVRKILDSVGAEVEEDKMEMLFKEVEGKDVFELLAAGREKFAYAPTGGSAGMDSAPAASSGGATAAEKKEEKAEEKMEEEEDDNMFSLFDD